MPDAIQKPRIFISSTIAEFSDLRQALKYWLEEMGFEVQLSEQNDFERKPDKGTIEACFDNIRLSDYYLLLIGGTKGSSYDKKSNVSVTRQEYRTAMESWEGSGKPEVVAVIRRETMIALLERKTAKTPDGAESRYLQDAAFVRDFVGEVRKEAQEEDAKEGKGEHPRSNWLAEFANFRELTDLLRATLNIRGPLQRAAVIENLQHELKRNVRLGLMKFDEDKMMPRASMLHQLRDEIVLTMENYLQEQFPLSHDQLKQMMLYLPTDASSLMTDALDEAIRSGVLLDYDVNKKKLKPSKLLDAAYRLRDAIAIFRRRHDVFFDDYKKVGAAWFQVKDSGGTAGVPPLSLLTVFATYDAEVNVFGLMVAILRNQYGNTEEIEYVARPRSSLEGEHEKMEAETVSEEELEDALQKDSFRIRLHAEPSEEKARELDEMEKDLVAKIGEPAYEELRKRIKQKIGEKLPETGVDVTEIVNEAFDEIYRPKRGTAADDE